MPDRDQTRAVLLLFAARDLLKRLEAQPAQESERAEMAAAIDKFLRHDIPETGDSR
jgi:hypothetical protein